MQLNIKEFLRSLGIDEIVRHFLTHVCRKTRLSLSLNFKSLQNTAAVQGNVIICKFLSESLTCPEKGWHKQIISLTSWAV